MTKIQDSFEYQAEQAKQTFQGCITALLEAHSDFLHKISLAKGAKKSGVWIEMSEAEIISGHILESVSNLMGSYSVIDRTNRLLNINYQAAQYLLNRDLQSSIDEFIAGKIDKDKLAYHFNQFVKVPKPGVVA